MKISGKIFSLYGLMIFLLASFFLPAKMFSQVQFYASSFFDKIEDNKFIEVRFVLENAEPDGFTPPVFKNFEIVSGPSEAHESTVINGMADIKSSYSYILKPLKTGLLTIQPGQIKVKSKILKSNSLTITVIKATKKIFKNLKKDDKFFVKAELSETIFYAGQQLVLTYKLYSSVNDKFGVRSEQESEMKGFQKQLIDYKFPVQKEMINDRLFSVYTLNTFVLFPLKVGKLEISPAGYLIEVDDYMGNVQNNRFHLKTESIMIDVKELPKGAPEIFTGQVGNYSVGSKIASPVQYVDEAFSLTIDVESEANINTLVAPQIKKYLTDFEVYEPKQIYQDIGVKSGKIISRKSFEYMLIPKKSGKQTIKIPYAYFDPAQKKYVEKFTEPIDIEITGQSKNKYGKVSEKSEIFASRTNLNLKKSSSPFFGSFKYFVILGLIFCSIPLLYYFRFIHPKHSKKDKLALLDIETKKQLKKIGLLIDEGNAEQFFRQIYDLLTKYVSIATGTSPIELTKDRLIGKLIESGIPEIKSREYSELLNKCEEALFFQNYRIDKTLFLNDSVGMLTYLQNELKK